MDDTGIQEGSEMTEMGMKRGGPDYWVRMGNGGNRAEKGVVAWGLGFSIACCYAAEVGHLEPGWLASCLNKGLVMCSNPISTTFFVYLFIFLIQACP